MASGHIFRNAMNLHKLNERHAEMQHNRTVATQNKQLLNSKRRNSSSETMEARRQQNDTFKAVAESRATPPCTRAIPKDRKLSRVGPGAYSGGRPAGKTGCRRRLKKNQNQNGQTATTLASVKTVLPGREGRFSANWDTEGQPEPDVAAETSHDRAAPRLRSL